MEAIKPVALPGITGRICGALEKYLWLLAKENCFNIEDA
jgi:hypothetical protein